MYISENLKTNTRSSTLTGGVGLVMIRLNLIVIIFYI